MADLNLYFTTLMKKEAGFVQNPADPGGATNKGITLKNWMAYGRDINGDGKINVSDLKELTDKDAFGFYWNHFWLPMKLESFRSQLLAELVFDHAVNAGIDRAVKMLQQILNSQFGRKDVVVDGSMGTHTIAAVNAQTNINEKNLCDAYLNFRQQYYAYRSNKPRQIAYDNFFRSLNVSPSDTAGRNFYVGWINRLDYFKKKVSV